MVTDRHVDDEVLLQHAWRNRLQSGLLLAAMAGYLAMLGWLLWGGDGLIMLMVMGGFAILANPKLSPWLIMRLYRARPLERGELPVLSQALAELAHRAGLESRPRLFYVPSRMLNAFAVGSRSQSAIAVTDGLLRQLETRELIGVLAHEVSHIQHNDLWVMGLADLFSRATSLLSVLGQALLLLNLPLILFSSVAVNWFAIALLILAPSLSALTQLALSRTREYDADLNAARLTGDPEGLARALARIERVQGGWLERIFLPGRRIPEPSLLRTHPRTEERIARLLALKPAQDFGSHPALRSATMPDGARPPGTRVSIVPRWHLNGLWY